MPEVLLFSMSPLCSCGSISLRHLVDLGCKDANWFDNGFNFDGKLLLLNAKERIEFIGHLQHLHLYGGGWHLAFTPTISVKQPFLISSDMSFNVVHDGMVSFELDEGFEPILPQIRRLPFLPISGQDWVGVIATKRLSNRPGPKRGRLLAFSRNQDFDFAKPQEIQVPTNPDLTGRLLGTAAEMALGRGIYRKLVELFGNSRQ